MTTKLDTKQLIGKLAAHPENEISLDDFLTIISHMINPPPVDTTPDWIGHSRIRKLKINAPATSYTPLDQNGKATVVRDYFRVIEQAEAGDEVLVEVQTGLAPVSLQKNIGSLLSTTKNPKFNHFKTSRTSEGVVVTFS